MKRIALKTLLYAVPVFFLCIAASFLWSLMVADMTRAVEICPLHGVHLQKKFVRIRHSDGFKAYPDGYDFASDAFFPYSADFCYGPAKGIVQRWAVVSFCPECRKAESEWIALKSGD